MKSKLDEPFQKVLWDIRKLLPKEYTNEILFGPNEYIFTKHKNDDEIRIHYLNNSDIMFKIEFSNSNNSYDTYSFRSPAEMIKFLRRN